MTSRRFVFTLNNPTVADYDRLNELATVNPDPSIGLLWAQSERGESGTLHFQGVVHFTNSVRATGVPAILGFSSRPHVEVQRAPDGPGEPLDPSTALGYVCKPDHGCTDAEYFSVRLGTPKRQGQRLDLESLKDSIKRGVPLKELAEEHFGVFMRYPSGVQFTYSLFNSGTGYHGPVDVIVLWGDSRTGKSHAPYARAGNAALVYPVPEPTSRTYFDGYHGQPIILFDDYAGNWLSWTELLKVTDDKPYLLHTKGATVPRFAAFRPSDAFQRPCVYFTSNVAPWLWYKNVSAERYESFWRRCTLVTYFGATGPMGPGGFRPSVKTQWTFEDLCHSTVLRDQDNSVHPR